MCDSIALSKFTIRLCKLPHYLISKTCSSPQRRPSISEQSVPIPALDSQPLATTIPPVTVGLTLPDISQKRDHPLCDCMCLALFPELNVQGSSQSQCVSGFTPFHGCVIFHCVEVPCAFIRLRTLGLFQAMTFQCARTCLALSGGKL